MSSKVFTGLAAIILMLSVLTGCGGDDQQGNTGNDGEGNAGQNSSGGSGEGSQAQSFDETVIGRVTRVDIENNRFVVRPQGEETEPILIRFNPDNVTVTMNGEDAAPDAVVEEQTAEVGYIINDDDNPIARVITLRTGEGDEMVSGRVTRVDLETNRFVVRPEGEDTEPLVLRFNPESIEITQDGQEVGSDALQEGQQVSSGYVVNDQDRQVARSIEISPSEGTTATPEETTAP